MQQHSQPVRRDRGVSVLFNEPKLLKYNIRRQHHQQRQRFSALQRAEIAEIADARRDEAAIARFSALQRAEIAEI